MIVNHEKIFNKEKLSHETVPVYGNIYVLCTLYTTYLFTSPPQYGDEHLKEIEDLWSALCTWPQNIRSTLNFLARLTCVSGNINIMLQQAKRIMVCFSRTKPTSIVSELMRDLRVIHQYIYLLHCCYQYIMYNVTQCSP